MGINIYVRCNCYEEGLCSELPVDKKLIYLDEHNDSYQIDTNNYEEENLFYSWEEHCCKHEDMLYFGSEYLNNYSVVSRLSCFLRELGDEFPYTYKSLKIWDGLITSDISEKVLNEIKNINSIDDLKNLAKKYNSEDSEYHDGKSYSSYYIAFYGTIERLKEGCKASIEIGRPLVFC